MSAPSRVLVTPRSLTAAGLHSVPELGPLVAAGYELVPGPAGRVPTEDELVALLPGCVGHLAGVERIGTDVLAAASSLAVISRNGVGTDGIDLDAARDAGVRVEVARGANAQGVAELAVLHVLNALRRPYPAMAALRDGEWHREPGAELASRTVGVVGLGSIGRAVARMVGASGARVVASDPMVGSSELATTADLPTLFEASDVISLHCPPTVTPLVDAEVLSRVPRGTVLVNTARSSLVDDRAVLAALESGTLDAYCVDAFDTEPPEPDALLGHPRCFATPHLGGLTTESVSRATSIAVQNLLAVLDEGGRGRGRN